MAEPVILRSSEAEWEVVNDDGFIYKRRKKKHISAPEAPASSISPSHLQHDKHWLRQRKKRGLQEMKARYVAEIDEWEVLLQKQEQPARQLNWPDEVTDPATSGDLTIEVPQDGCQMLIESLLLQVEQQEKCIEMFEKLCIDAESTCKRLDEDFADACLSSEWFKSPRFLVHGILSPDNSSCN